MTTGERIHAGSLWPWLSRTLGRQTYMTLLFVLWVWAWVAYIGLHLKGYV